MTNIRDFRVGWRMLRRDPTYSAAAIFGLAIGFAVFFLLIGFVHYSFSYEKEIPDSDRIYVLKSKSNFFSTNIWAESVPFPYRDLVEQGGAAHIFAAVIPFPVSMRNGDNVLPVELSVVDPAFEQVFGIRTLHGDLRTALTRPDALALTVATATRVFGRTDVVGKSLLVEGKPYFVAALVDNPPVNTTVPYFALTGMNSAFWPDEERRMAVSNWLQRSCRIYIKLAPDASPSAFQQHVQEALDKAPFRKDMPSEWLSSVGNAKFIDIQLGRLSDAYFNQDVIRNGELEVAQSAESNKRGDKPAVTALAAIAFLVLLLATTNYVNLAAVKALARQREISVRKTLGASARDIVRQFLMESILTSLFAVALGLLMAWLFLPIFADLLNRDLSNLFSAWYLFYSLLFGLFVGVAAGVYPAWLARKIHAGKSLPDRGSVDTAKGLRVRRILSILQFSMATALITVSIAVTWQAVYARKFDPGFDPAPLLVIKLPNFMDNPVCKALREKIGAVPGVSGVASTKQAVGRDHWDNHIMIVGADGRLVSVSLGIRGVSPDFFEVYGMHAVAGRLYDSKIDAPGRIDVGVINSVAARALGFSSNDAAVGKMLTYQLTKDRTGTAQVIGIAPEIRNETLREKLRPVAYSLAVPTSVLTVRINGDMEKVRHAIEVLWKIYFPNDALKIEGAESLFSQNYDGDMRMAMLFTASSIIAISIAGYGVYVLAAYNVQRRAREIVLRKLHGAKRRDIARLIGNELIILLAIGAAIGLPIAGAGIAYYLKDFVERANMGLWPMIFSLVIVVLVACAATLRHTLIAIRLSPALALRG